MDSPDPWIAAGYEKRYNRGCVYYAGPAVEIRFEPGPLERLYYRIKTLFSRPAKEAETKPKDKTIESKL